jgi:predicted SAM-dependent methyltransferase
MGLGLGLHVRLVRALHVLSRKRRQRARRPLVRHAVERLHIGSGPLVREGWTNVDIEYHPGVAHVLDVRDGLPFRGAQYVYAEHFIEHLTYDEGFRFLKECRAVLRDDGVLRLSTPNLDWVHATQYASGDAVRDCFAMNKAFRAWGHQFLYNLAALRATLQAAGFADVAACRYGESSDPNLRGLERHEVSADSAELPHVIVVEARGRRDADDAPLAAAVDDYDWALRS